MKTNSFWVIEKKMTGKHGMEKSQAIENANPLNRFEPIRANYLVNCNFHAGKRALIAKNHPPVKDY